MNNICLDLLRYDMCIDNEYFSKYRYLVSQKSNIPEHLIYENHHIIPRAVYAILGIPTNNNPDNLIALTIKDHVLAHYYLSLCSKNSKFKFSNITCIALICNRSYSDINEEWINSNLEYLDNLRKEQRSLNSLMQKGLQAGDNNPNCKVTLAKSAEIKELLLTGFTSTEIAAKLTVPERLVKLIINGKHWTCKEDNFKFDTRGYKKAIKLATWIAEKHCCLNCGVVMTEKRGDGRFCSSRCGYIYSANQRSSDYYIKAISNRRSYRGENNPNYGKKASEQTRRKISDGIKNTGAYSPRFTGHKHTEESKQKTSNSLKLRYKEKRELIKNISEDD